MDWKTLLNPNRRRKSTITGDHRAEFERDFDRSVCKKPGYFTSEADIVKQVREETGTAGARNPICYLVEAADDIVYLAADVEDAVKKGVLSWYEVEGALRDASGDSGSDAQGSRVSVHLLGLSRSPANPSTARGSAIRRPALAPLL